MTKCEFCTQSLPNGKCSRGGFLAAPSTREWYCKKAIEKMTEALSKQKGGIFPAFVKRQMEDVKKEMVGEDN